MDRNFFLPIAVAAGVHSMLFISGTPQPRTVPPVVSTVAVFDEVVLPPLEPEIRVSEESLERTTDAPPPPRSIGLPSPTFDTDDITQVFDPLDMLPRPDGPVAETIATGWADAIGKASGPKNGIFNLIGLDNTPAARFQPAPTYPQDLKATGFDGSVTVMFAVDVKGEVFDATVTNASHSRFAEEALRAVRRWRFEPGIKDGKRVAFRMVQTFSFTLSE